MKKNYTIDFDFSEGDFAGDIDMSKKDRFEYWCSNHHNLFDAIENKKYRSVDMIIDTLLFYVDSDFCNSYKINEIKTTLKLLKSNLNRRISKNNTKN